MMDDKIPEESEIFVHPKDNGFFNLPVESSRCFNPEHFPPSHLYIPPGKGYKHTCPGCGKINVLTPLNITY